MHFSMGVRKPSAVFGRRVAINSSLPQNHLEIWGPVLTGVCSQRVMWFWSSVWLKYFIRVIPDLDYGTCPGIEGDNPTGRGYMAMHKNHLLEALTVGKPIMLQDAAGQTGRFRLNTGDALLNGGGEQVWLCDDRVNQPRYLRRLPKKPLSVGVALFASLEELTETLETGCYYIG
jgi:hypothetical protein